MAKLINKKEETFYTYEFNSYEKDLILALLFSAKEQSENNKDFPKEFVNSIGQLVNVFLEENN